MNLTSHDACRTRAVRVETNVNRDIMDSNSRTVRCGLKRYHRRRYAQRTSHPGAWLKPKKLKDIQKILVAPCGALKRIDRRDLLLQRSPVRCGLKNHVVGKESRMSHRAGAETDYGFIIADEVGRTRGCVG